MKYQIAENIFFWTGTSKEDEGDGYFEGCPHPMFQFTGKTHNSFDLPIKTKEEYISVTNDLFWFLAEAQKLLCPKCNHRIDYDDDPGDASVGMQGYRMAGCVDDNCHFAMDGQTEEVEKELIRTIFPLYWRWLE